MDEEDVEGTLKVLADAVNDHMAPEADIYYGALIALETIGHQAARPKRVHADSGEQDRELHETEGVTK